MRRALAHPLVPLFAALLLLPHLLPLTRATVSLATEIEIFVLLGLAFNLLLGYTGLTSFGHGAFFGIAAYAGSLAQIHLLKGVAAPILVGVAAGAILGGAIGFLVMRKRGVYFSLLTLAFTQMLFSIVYRWTDVTGGENGLGGIERPALTLPLLGTLDLGDAMTYYHFVFVFVAAGVILVWRIVHSPFGRTLQAIRENEQRASFVGYNTRAYKFSAFVLSCTFTGLAGILYALLIRFVYPQTVHVDFSGEILAMTVVGGMRHFLGPALGGAFFVFFRDFLSAYTENWLIVFGALFMLFIVVSPQGIFGIGERLALALGLLRRDAEATPPPRPAGAPSAPPPPSSPAVIAVPSAPLPSRWGRPSGRPAGGAEAPPLRHAAGERDRMRDAVGPPILEVQGLTKRFGALVAVDGVDLTVRRGELFSVIGPNGAGKTTLFNALTGLFAPEGGRAIFRGQDITAWPPHALVRWGMARSFQIVSVFHDLTAFENVRLAVQAKRGTGRRLLVRADALEDINGAAWAILDRVGLSEKAAAQANSLSHGDQRLLEIGIVLATEPELLLLDEPLAGLAPAERSRVARMIRELAGAVTVVLIEHDIDRVLAISDRIVVLHQGRVIAEGTPAEVQSNADVQAAYLGGGACAAAGQVPADMKVAAPLLAVEGLNTFYGKSHVLHDVSLEVGEGQVVALLGRNGAGKTTTLHSIMGAVPPRWGKVIYRGEELVRRSPEEIARRGIGLVPQGRRIFPNLTVFENLAIAARPGANGNWTPERIFALFPKLGALRSSKGEQLSGGERQMLAIARALMGNPQLLLLDEPFEGLAPAVIDGVVRALEELRGRTTMLLVEQNADLALALADRAYVLNNGMVAYSGPAPELRADHDLRTRLLGV